jgi:hypothetical protein
MKVFHVEVEGRLPVLMHAMGPVIDQTTTSRKAKLTPEQAAEKSAYRDPDGYLVVPALNIMACLIAAARPVKLPRGTGFRPADVIKGSVRVAPQLPRLLDAKGKPMKDFVVDSQWVRNPSTGGKMPCHRARIELPWRMKFDLKWNELIYAVHPDVIKDVLKRAENTGLCDYRPMYGLFEATKVEVEDL